MFKPINPQIPFLIGQQKKPFLIGQPPQPQPNPDLGKSDPFIPPTLGTDSRNNSIITDQQTGQATGVNTPNGSFLGLDKKTANAVLATQGINPPGNISVEQANQAAQAAAQAQKGQEAAKGLGSLTPEQRNIKLLNENTSPLDVGGGILAGLGAGAGVGAGIGAAVGVLGGPAAPLTVPIFSGGGALLGAGFGFVKGLADKRQNVAEAYALYTGVSKNMAFIINQVNSGKMDVFTASEMWDNELGNFNAAERNLKMDTSTELKKFVSGGADKLARLEEFKTRIPFYQHQLEQAMINPNPNQIIQEPTDVTTQ